MNRKASIRRPFFRKTDLFVVLLLVLLSVALLWVGSPKQAHATRVARIYYKDQLIEEVTLLSGVEKDFHFTEHPGLVIRQYDDQSIAYLLSDCPDQVCVKTGKIRRAGEFSACVPNGFLIVISASNEQENDADVDLIA